MADTATHPYDPAEQADLLAEMLATATAACATDHPDPVAQVGHLFSRIHPDTNVLVALHGWVDVVNQVAPLPRGRKVLPGREPRTGQRWNLTGEDPGMVLGHRMFALMANGDLHRATALWEAAVEGMDAPNAGNPKLAIMGFLYRCASILALRLPDDIEFPDDTQEVPGE